MEAQQLVVRVTRRSQETLAQFHDRMIRNSEAAAERYDQRAAASTSATSAERFRSKARIERRNADHHRQQMATIRQGTMIGH